jgi:hypothetical protein
MRIMSSLGYSVLVSHNTRVAASSSRKGGFLLSQSLISSSDKVS